MTIQQFYNKNKDSISAIYKVGSKIIPFLKDISRDEDYAVVLFNGDDQKKLISFVKENNLKGIVFKLPYQSSQFKEWSYQNYYNEKLFGDQNCNFYTLNVLDNKEEYYDYLKNNAYKILNHKYKSLYHYVFNMYLLQNNSYEFTEIQINNIRQAHENNANKQLLQEVKDYYNIEFDLNNLFDKDTIEKNKEIKLINQEIELLKQKLNNSDYKVIKYTEGLINEEEYLIIKQKRQSWRNRINELEDELNKL